MAASFGGDLGNDHNPATNAQAALNRMFLSAVTEGNIDEAGRLLEEGASCDAMSVNGCVERFAPLRRRRRHAVAPSQDSSHAHCSSSQ